MSFRNQIVSLATLVALVSFSMPQQSVAQNSYESPMQSSKAGRNCPEEE
jgi:hypothetical protein